MVHVAVFDSGLGGLSVLGEMRRASPSLPVTYLADQARAPYGDRTPGEIVEFTLQAVGHLTRRGADAVVIACNTASSDALEEARRRFPETPIVGMEPAVKPAVTATRSGVIGVLATTRTVSGRRLARLIERHADGIDVLTQACPGWVEMVEDGLTDGPATLDAVARFVGPLIAAGADTIVLGCTHYSFLAEPIRRVAGSDVTIIDPAAAVARHTLSRLPTDVAYAPSDPRFETTADPVRFRRQILELTGWQVPTFGVAVKELAEPADTR